MRKPTLRALAAILLAALLGCEQPSTPDVPAERSRSMYILMVLIPQSSCQPLFVRPATHGGGLDGLRSELYRVLPSGAEELVSIGRPVPDSVVSSPCTSRYGKYVFARSATITHEFSPRFGATYRLVVSAEDRPTATATVTVPGRFHILGGRADGRPPGTEGLFVRWSESEGAYRYFVALRPDEAPRCPDIRGCEDSWFVSTRGTQIHTTVPEWVYQKGSGPWYVDVWAMSEALYKFLTTGHGGFFPVPPVQNVENGYGVFGAWVIHSAFLTDSVPL